MNVQPSIPSSLRTLIGVAAVYDLGLGLVFFLFPAAIYTWLNISPAPPVVDTQLAAGLIATLGFALALIWRRPAGSHDLLLVSIAGKLVYIGVAVLALARGDLPHPMFGLFAVLDVLFLLGFVQLLRSLPAPIAPDAGRQAVSQPQAGNAP